MAITLKGYVLDNAGLAKSGVTVEAWHHDGVAAAATTTTDVNGLWTHAALDATKTWVIKVIDGTKVLKIDARSQIQITTADVITSINVDTINEHTAATGVTIDGVLIKDGLVDGIDVSSLSASTISIRKTADETVNNSKALQNDDHLLFAVTATEVVSFAVVLKFISATATPSLQVSFAVPAGGSVVLHSSADIGVLAATTGVLAGGSAFVFDTNASARYAILWGLYVAGGTAGNVQLQWAQNVATVEDTKILTNSHILKNTILV